MIVFVGAEDRGYWVRETAQIRGEELEFVESSMTIQEQINEILRHSGDYIIFDIEQYVDNAEALAEEVGGIKEEGEKLDGGDLCTGV